MGVFATRSPYRPNDIGLSSVRLERVEWETGSGPVLWVKGAGSSGWDAHLRYQALSPDVGCPPGCPSGIRGGYGKDRRSRVVFPKELLEIIPEPLRGVIKDLLRQDPRPGYDADKKREYRMSYGGYDVTFLAEGACLTVTDVRRMV